MPEILIALIVICAAAAVAICMAFAVILLDMQRDMSTLKVQIASEFTETRERIERMGEKLKALRKGENADHEAK
ncbi:MAG: hypothetical protein A4E20_08895 [Nitrospira sp. SG-bin2]|uniref:hypothetical protein n=1 Tax=Nitrospira cf. moscoviensis SBR1015 TaxID=96242 RepID=UPI000A0A26DA|nr:hypothetical protein [Nitrospira cf. moscoviensis SBR1015]OQW35848.1 MAG: hypothetical protein A4E20_08895 [Nitrospira sp. SG-bin2]